MAGYRKRKDVTIIHPPLPKDFKGTYAAGAVIVNGVQKPQPAKKPRKAAKKAEEKEKKADEQLLARMEEMEREIQKLKRENADLRKQAQQN